MVIKMLKDVLKKEYIRVDEEALDWKEAVRKANLPLLEHKCIKESYIDGTIEMVKQLGPYIVICPGIAIAHARPEAGVLKNSISLITLKKPVRFGHSMNDPVKLVFTLAAKSNEGHLSALSDLALVLGDESKYDRIMKASTVDELYDCLIS